MYIKIARYWSAVKCNFSVFIWTPSQNCWIFLSTREHTWVISSIFSDGEKVFESLRSYAIASPYGSFLSLISASATVVTGRCRPSMNYDFYRIYCCISYILIKFSADSVIPMRDFAKYFLANISSSWSNSSLSFSSSVMRS